MPRVLADQRRRHWERLATETLPGKTLGVVGLGHVGREVSRVARAAGLRVMATARTAGTPGGPPPLDRVEDAGAGVAHVVLPPSALDTLLAQSDYVALTVPLTPETRGLIGAAELARMKPGAVLINVARGAVVDEPALSEALRRRHLGGAALDVFVVEPLPSDSPLWAMSNVLVTPHSMSTAVDENQAIAALFCENLRRYLAGQPLRNRFDRTRGY
jgi:glyoxylate/hydroxypyruvate reductase A